MEAFWQRLRNSAEWKWLEDVKFAGNEMWRLLALAGALLVALVVARILRWILSSAAGRARRRERPVLAAAFTALARATLFAALVVGWQVGCQFLVLNETMGSIRAAVQGVLVTLAVGYAVYCLIGVADEWLKQFSSKTKSRLDDMLVPLVRRSLQATVVVLILVQIATLLSDKPVTSIIAGLGIGGLAVGLAAQDTIKAFFGSMVIFADRPFELGDEITADGHTGVVETVGFRSTRFRTGDGYLVTIPNGQLANMTIVNVSRRRNLIRRMSLQIAGGLPAEKVERAVAIVRELLAGHEGEDLALPARVHLTEFAGASLTISIVYWYHPADKWKFAAFNHALNLAIVRRFAAEGITLAGPIPPPADATAAPAARPRAV